MLELTIRLETKSTTPLYEQIYEYIKNEIQSGGLPCGTRLPSTRMLANHLEISRSTVTYAYEQLLSEGYISNRKGSGFFVNDLEGLYHLDSRQELEPPQNSVAKSPYLYDFSPSGVDLRSFPHNTWRRLYRGLLSEHNEELYRMGSPQGEEELRRTIASYVHQARGVRCHPSQIIIGAGNDYLLMLLNAILGDGQTFAFENPTYRKAYDIFRILGRKVITVNRDEQGMCVDALEESNATCAYVMPSHHYPLGTVMLAPRRIQLLKWATQEGRYIIEDDYDSEFRYRGKPIPALQGFDGNARVIYIGTFSKSIAPAIRISFMILPVGLMEAYGVKGHKFSCTVPRMDQNVLATFIREGYYERHLNRMRSVYKNRHDLLLDCLKPLQEMADISGEYAGTHLLLKFKNGMSEKEAIRRAQRAKIRLYALSDYYVEGNAPQDTVILGYANIRDEDIKKASELLFKALTTP